MEKPTIDVLIDDVLLAGIGFSIAMVIVLTYDLIKLWLDGDEKK